MIVSRRITTTTVVLAANVLTAVAVAVAVTIAVVRAITIVSLGAIHAHPNVTARRALAVPARLLSEAILLRPLARMAMVVVHVVVATMAVIKRSPQTSPG